MSILDVKSYCFLVATFPTSEYEINPLSWFVHLRGILFKFVNLVLYLLS